MALEVRVKPLARKDLAEIHDWTWFRFGQAQADRYISDIASGFKLIAENPGIASDASSVRKGLKKFISGSHILFLRVDRKTVTIIRILHGSMDHSRWLK